MNFLQENKLELVARMEWMAEQTNDLQTIRAYMNNRYADIKLTDTQEFKLKRWQFVYDQMSSGKYTQQEIRSQLELHFKISASESLADMRTAQELFSSTLSINKLFKIQIDIQLLEIMQQKAREANKLDEYAKLQRVKNELYKMLPDEVEKPSDDFEPRQNHFEYNPELLGLQRVSADKMKALVEQLKQDHGITDITYEEIQTNDTGKDTSQ